jgi:hypothetical protein
MTAVVYRSDNHYIALAVDRVGDSGVRCAHLARSGSAHRKTSRYVS